MILGDHLVDAAAFKTAAILFVVYGLRTAGVIVLVTGFPPPHLVLLGVCGFGVLIVLVVFLLSVLQTRVFFRELLLSTNAIFFTLGR